MPAPDRLSALDASFLGLEDGTAHMHVGAVLLFEPGELVAGDGGLDIARIRRGVEAKLHLVKRYRQKLAYVPYERHPVWIDDTRFNLEYHVRLTALPKPGGPEELKRLSGRVMSQQLDRGKPLWEMWMVEGLRDGGFAMITKTHHCMIDGIAGTDLLAALLDLEPEPPAARVQRWHPRPPPHGVSLVMDSVLHRLERPAAMLRTTRNALREPAKTLRSAESYVESIAEVLAPGLRGGSKTPLNVQIGPHRHFEWVTMSLEDVKAVKNVMGGTVNDVVLATVAGALRRFFKHRRVGVNRLDVRAMVPVSVRTEDERGQPGNRIATLSAPLPVHIHGAKARLDRVRKTMGDLKQSKQAIGAERLAAAAEWTVPNLLVQAVRLTSRARAYNLVVTNVPGPQIPLYLQGAKLRQAYPLVPLWTNQALGIALLSYDGGLYWGLNADWDALPDVHRVSEFLEESFAELQRVAGLANDGKPRAAAESGARARATGKTPKRKTGSAKKPAATKRKSGGARTRKTSRAKSKAGGTR